MYRFAYADVLDAPPCDARERQRLAVDHAVERLQAAMEAGSGTRELAEAAAILRSVWAARIEDLTTMPRAGGADLIAVGRWIMQETDKLRLGGPADLAGLIEVSRLMADLQDREQ